MADLSGMLPVLPSPFTADGKIDAASTRRAASFALSAGVDGVVFPGFASEVAELTPDERRQMLTAVAEEVGGRLPIVAGGSAETPQAVESHARVALDLGIETLMVQPPLHLGRDTEAVAAFLDAAVAKVPDIRLILQNAPAPRGSDLTPGTILDVARRVGQIVYVKEETLPAGPAITALMSDRPSSLKGVIGGGGARYILDEYERGACAAMPALEIADLHVKLDRAWRAGRFDEARAIYVRTLPLLTLQAVYRMRLTKHVLMRRGVLENTIVRAATPDLDDVATADIDRNLIELGLLAEMPAAKAGAA